MEKSVKKLLTEQGIKCSFKSCYWQGQTLHGKNFILEKSSEYEFHPTFNLWIMGMRPIPSILLPNAIRKLKDN